MRGQPPSAACPERSRRVRERSPLASAPCPSSAAGAQSKAQRCSRSPNHRGTRRRPPAVSHHRPQHRRQDSDAEDGRPAGADGAIRNSGSRRSRGNARVRCGSRRYRRLPIDRAEPFDLLRARHQHRFHFTHGHRAIARPARRTGLRHRSRGRRGARGRDRRILRPNRMHDRHLHSPHFLESLRRKYSRSDQRLRRLQRNHSAADLRVKDGSSGGIRGNQHRTAAGLESGHHRVGAVTTGHPGPRRGRILRQTSRQPARSRERPTASAVP